MDSTDKSKKWITYEEVIDANALTDLYKQERSFETEWAVQQRKEPKIYFGYG